MNIFKMIYSFFYYLYVKMFYHLAYKQDKKEVIYQNRKKTKYVIVVKDAEIGKQLYEISKFLKAEHGASIIEDLNTKLTFANFGLTWRNRVSWICIEGWTSNKWEYFLRLEKLQKIQAFVDKMQHKGWVLDNTKFDCSKWNSVSEVLSFFTQSKEEDKIEQSKGCMIQLIHYVFSNGGDIKEFYEDFMNKGVCEGYKFPYNSPIAKMCYDYAKTGATPNHIYRVLEDACSGAYANYSLVVIPDKVETEFEPTERANDYTIYDGCMKIYHKSSQEDGTILGETGLIDESSNATLERMETIIVDLDNNIIGYKFAKLDEQKMLSVMSYPFESQNQIFSCVISMVNYFKEYNSTQAYMATKSHDFDIETCIVCGKDYRNRFIFRCNTIKDLANLSSCGWGVLKDKVTVVLFKLLANFMAKKYGELTSKEQFFEHVEVRFLSPVVASQFVNFALGEKVNYQLATVELFKFFDNKKVSKKSTFSYDARFCLTSLPHNIAFDYEAVNKYNVKLEKGTTEKLPDGRTLVILKRSQNISAFIDNEYESKKNIKSKIGGYIEDENVKFAGISEVIVGTQRLNSDNMYNIVGYILEELKGVQLTDQTLLNLNNRDLLKVAGYLFSKFAKYYIHWNNIWMDKDFKFYINYMDENFQVSKSSSEIETNSEFVQRVFDNLVEIGYNPNAFVGWKLPYSQYNRCKQYLLEMANCLNDYCDEHQIYYDSKFGQCPVCAQTKYLVPQDYKEALTKVFEDSVAVHYSIDATYNLKVYKHEYKDKVEENVSKLISLRLIYPDTELGFFQDCFLPCKWALDSNKQFVGYIYDATNFTATIANPADVCIDLEDANKLKNLARLKSLIRLILQVKDIISQKRGFMMNPFSHVFLNKSHKKQVQILNIEFICPCNRTDLKQTKQWTCDYIYKILESDPTIEFERSVIPEGLDAILKKLTELADQMSKYCTIHGIYYKDSYVFCPKCVDPSKQVADIEYVTKSVYDSKESINEGGEALIYSHSKGTVAKVFKDAQINRDFKNMVLFRIMSKKDILERINREKHKYKCVYPKKILVDKATKEVFAYLMDEVTNGFPISTLKDKVKIEELGLSRKDVFEIIITIGEGIEALHKYGIYIGDLNGRNILFDTNKNVYFIDFDGMGVDEIAPEFCTDGYIDPVSKKNQCITMKDDWYSYAVQVFYYLTYTHPFNGIYYEVKNGRKVLLDIPDKMERRISLLGNHGMKPPAIAVSWEWMNAELQTAFLNIFEGTYRESILPYLKNQYQTLFSTNQQPLNNGYRINSKFIATKHNPFNGNVVKVLNPYSAICENGNDRFIAILNDSKVQATQIEISFVPRTRGGIEDYCLLSDDGKIAFLVYGNNKVLTAVDVESQKTIYCVSYEGNVVVNDRTSYLAGNSKENYVIFKRTIQPNGEVVKETIGVGTQEIKWFDVKFNTKFILIKKATETMDELYCNSEKFITFEYNSVDRAKQVCYNIIYDEVTKSWLVINNYGKGVVIQLSGRSMKVDISKYINDVNFANICFEKGNIYIPDEECMYIINLTSSVTKKMECRGIMAPNSKIYDINSNGFSVITDNVLYEVRKG